MHYRMIVYGRTLRGESQTASADRALTAVLEVTIDKKGRVIAEVSEEYLDGWRYTAASDDTIVRREPR